MNIMQLKAFAEQHNPWKARVYGSAAQNLTNGAFTMMAYGTIDFDPANIVTTGVGGGITIPVDGIYHVGVAGAIASVADTGRGVFSIFKNGGEFKRGTDWTNGATNPMVGSVNAIMYCLAGDFIQIGIYTDAVSRVTSEATPFAYISVAYLSAA